MKNKLMKKQKSINAKDLICMDEHSCKYHYKINLAYSKSDNLLFGERIYKSDARLCLHKILAEIVFVAANNCYNIHGLHFVLYDGLRTIDAQKAMMQTQRAIKNPHWIEKPRMLSPVGSGGHPRGMAIDIGLITPKGEILDMGCAFDHLDKKAHRNYKHPQNIMNNRNILNECMANAAKQLEVPILLLPEEWWDFRLPPHIYEQYAPLSDSDLPENMCLI